MLASTACMTKRPKGIYLVALWVVLAFKTQFVLSSSLFALFPHGVDWSRYITEYAQPTLRFAFLLLLIYLVVGLIRLDPVAMWTFSGFCVVGSLLPVFLLVLLPLSHRVPTMKLVVGLCTFIAINAAVVWYLVRPAFRSAAAAYRRDRDEQRRARLRDKYIAERLRKGVQS